MNFESLEGLSNEEFLSLYNNIVEEGDIVSTYAAITCFCCGRYFCGGTTTYCANTSTLTYDCNIWCNTYQKRCGGRNWYYVTCKDFDVAWDPVERFCAYWNR